MKISKKYSSEHTPKALFEAWISPEMLISPAIKIEVDPVVGGHYILHAESDLGVFIMRGEFLEIVPGKKLSYTWWWEGTDENTIVNVGFSTTNDATTIYIEHSGFLTSESKERHEVGWDHYVGELEKKIKNLV